MRNKRWIVYESRGNRIDNAITRLLDRGFMPGRESRLNHLNARRIRLWRQLCKALGIPLARRYLSPVSIRPVFKWTAPQVEEPEVLEVATMSKALPGLHDIITVEVPTTIEVVYGICQAHPAIGDNYIVYAHFADKTLAAEYAAAYPGVLVRTFGIWRSMPSLRPQAWGPHEEHPGVIRPPTDELDMRVAAYRAACADHDRLRAEVRAWVWSNDDNGELRDNGDAPMWPEYEKATRRMKELGADLGVDLEDR